MSTDSTGHQWNKTDGENKVMREKPDHHKSHINLLSMEPRPLQRTVWQLTVWTTVQPATVSGKLECVLIILWHGSDMHETKQF